MLFYLDKPQTNDVLTSEGKILIFHIFQEKRGDEILWLVLGIFLLKFE